MGQGLSEAAEVFSKDDVVLESAGSTGQVHCLIVALDYNYASGFELTSSLDGELMVRIARHAGCTDVTTVTDRHLGHPNFPVRRFVLDQIKEIGARCRKGDWFVWFYAGHGVNVPDVDGDEEDGLDEAFVTPDKEGRLTESALLVDDDFARALDTFIPDGVRILCICDCCHSGTICDIDTFAYRHDIYQISASSDSEEAEDTGKGGALTWALKKTLIKNGMKYGTKPFSLQKVAEGCQKRVRSSTGSMQTVCVQYNGTPPERVAWPLCFPVWRWADKVPYDLCDTEAKK